jgi:hypothetical protein
VLEIGGFLVFGKSKVCEHFFGKKTATIPAMQIRLKIEPINGFRQRRFSWIVGGYNVSISVVNNPKRETLTANTRMKSGFVP